jgi:hypothetical protein
MDKPSGNIVTEMIGGFFSVLKEILGALAGVLPTAVSFLFWVLCGIIILPCVFIAGNFFDKWTKWAEKF